MRSRSVKHTLKKPVPRRSTLLPWDRDTEIRAMLPPENPQRKLYAASVSTLEEMPAKLTYALVDLIVEDAKLSKGKARKAIRAGQVTVNGTVVRDPDMRVDGDSLVAIHL